MWVAPTSLDDLGTPAEVAFGMRLTALQAWGRKQGKWAPCCGCESGTGKCLHSTHVTLRQGRGHLSAVGILQAPQGSPLPTHMACCRAACCWGFKLLAAVVADMQLDALPADRHLLRSIMLQLMPALLAAAGPSWWMQWWLTCSWT